MKGQPQRKRLLFNEKQLGGTPMKSQSIRSITASAALLAAAPLAYVGLSPLLANKSHPKAEEVTTQVDSRDDETVVEVFVHPGDSSAILKALHRLPADGGRVILAPGVFEVHEPIILDRDNVELRGSGKLTVLKLADRAACPVIVVGSTTTPIPRIVSKVRVRNLVIDGNRRTQEPECWGGVCDSGGLTFIRNNALTIRGAEEIKIEHLVTRNARSGGVVLEKVCRQIYIDDLEATDNHFDGLACYETEDSYFSRLNLHHNQSAGISLDLDFNHNVIKMARLANNGSQGIFMRDSNSNDFRKIEIVENGAQGIFVAQADNFQDTRCTNNTFSDLTVMKNVGHGLRVNDLSCVDNVIRNSKFQENDAGNVSQATDAILAMHNVTGI